MSEEGEILPSVPEMAKNAALAAKDELLNFIKTGKIKATDGEEQRRQTICAVCKTVSLKNQEDATDFLRKTGYLNGNIRLINGRASGECFVQCKFKQEDLDNGFANFKDLPEFTIREVLTKDELRCSFCGCFMKWKWKTSTPHCPLSKF